jgi:hypothetical protein
MFMLRVVGNSFSFYSVRLSPTFHSIFVDYDRVKRLQRGEQWETLVYKLAIGGSKKWRFDAPAEREVIINVIDQIRQVILATTTE